MARSKGISYSGPFFDKDPVKTFAQNVQDFMAEVAKAGEEDVRALMRGGNRAPMRGIEPARVQAHVVGRVHSLTGKHWQQTAVVSVNNRGLTRTQGITLMAAASQVESQTHAFRRAQGRLNRARTDLLKGLT